MQINLEFHGRHAVVFGGTTGINFGIANAFAAQGADVTVVSRRPENVSNAVEQLAVHGHRVSGTCADVRDFDAVGRALSETVSRFGPVDVLVSGAAKAGVDQLTRVLALEWGGEGVRVNAISPGPIDGTEGVRRLMAQSDAERERATSTVPLKRLGTLDDIANLALFLASPYASFISGAVIPCDGGGALESVKPALEAAGDRASAQSR